ncbi:MAG: helix-turn-helix domain-containing protein [Paludibacteraceae bacterium]|nr:helix-turn-helix domain-containing protein [Paludibacteraceae bacterium]
MTREELGRRIKAVRAEKQMKQTVVADAMGITVGAYIKLETGKTKINIDHLSKLSSIFKVHIATFFVDEIFLGELGVKEMANLGNDIRSMIAAELASPFNKK